MNASLLCLALSASYAGMLALCLGTERHWKQLAAAAPPSLRAWCRPLGVLLLLLAMLLSLQIWQPAWRWSAGWACCRCAAWFCYCCCPMRQGWR